MFFPLHTARITVDDISSFFGDRLSVSVLRLDRIDPLISGNKWFKLRFYIDAALEQQKKGLLTFGGAWSNHLLATAAACKQTGLSCTGIIRGEEPARLSDTLLQAKEMGMQLVFVSRDEYKRKEIPVAHDDLLLVPEGGYGRSGMLGAATILSFAPAGFTHYCCAVGTGTTVAGLIESAQAGQSVTGFSVMKNNFSLEEEINALVENKAVSWQLQTGYHFGGYARHTPELIAFMNDLYRQTGIPSDFVYTAKLFYGVWDLIKRGHFNSSERLLLIHTGGLQGNRSLAENTLLF